MAVSLRALIPVLLAALVWPAGASAGEEEPRRQLERYYVEIETLRGGFEQVVLTEDGRLIEESRGTFEIARPDRFRWRYESPYEQVIVADGERLWIYDVDLDQVTVRPLAEVLGAGPARLLAGEADGVDEAFAVSAADEPGWLRLEPHDGAGEVERAWLRLRDGVPDGLEVHDALGQVTDIRFHDLERNPRLDPETFRFEPPEGVDVIDQEAPGAVPP